MDVNGTRIPGRGLAIAGAWMQLGWVIGVVGVVLGMMSAFQSLGSQGIASPQLLAASVGFVLIAGAVAMMIPVAGLVMLGISIFGYQYRAPWLFWFLIFDGAFLVFVPHFGVFIAIPMLIFVIVKRDEFLGGGVVPRGV